MKTHLVFCCNRICAKEEMGAFIDSHSSYQIVVKLPDTAFIEGDRYFFMVDINRSPERIFGFLVDSFKVCPHYRLSDVVTSYLKSHSTNYPKDYTDGLH